MTVVPTFDLYGEADIARHFNVHCETISSRSRLHRWEIGLHRHERFFQLLYISAGSGDVVLGEGSTEIIPPTIVTVPPGLDHGFRFSKDVGGFVITILMSHLRAQVGEHTRLGTWLSARRQISFDHDDAYLAQTLERLGETCLDQDNRQNDLRDSCLIFALQLARECDERRRPLGVSDEPARRMGMLHDLMQRHSRDHKPAGFYAEALGISTTHLNRLVKAATGLGTHELIARKLIEQAQRELVFTLGSIHDVATRLGFSDPAYFSRFFLKQTGQTPRAWRAKQRACREKISCPEIIP